MKRPLDARESGVLDLSHYPTAFHKLKLGSSVATKKIGIAGAGIGGLTAAAYLLRQGLDVRLYEQADAFARVGTGIQMGPNPMKILIDLGLQGDLERVAYSPPSLANRVWDTGELTFDLPLGSDAERIYGAPYYLLHRGDLHAALQNVVPPETIRLGHRITGVAEDADGVRIDFADRPSDTVDILIGADGVHSPTRESLFTSTRPLYTGKVAYRAVFPAELVRRAPAGPATKWWGPDRHIVIYYVSAGRELYFTTGVPEPEPSKESWSAMGDLDELRRAFEGFHPDVMDVLEACPAVNKWAIYDRDPMDSWHTGRVVLLGDACHPMTPYMAQGAATAMEDAVVLARCIEEFGLQEAPSVFQRYEDIRKPRTSLIQSISRANTWLREQTDPTPIYGYNALTVSLEPGAPAVAHA